MCVDKQKIKTVCMSRDNNDIIHQRKLRPEYLNKLLNNGIIEINNDITLFFYIITGLFFIVLKWKLS